MLRPASANPADILADAAYPILLAGGARALSWRGLARQLQTSVGTMADWAPRRDEAFHLVAQRLVGRYEEGIKGRLYRQAFAAFLPLDAEEMAACKVLLAVEELGRSFPLVAMTVAEAHEREQDLLRLQGVTDPKRPHAVLRGLRVAISDPAQPMDLAEAHRTWVDLVLQLCGTQEAS